MRRRELLIKGAVAGSVLAAGFHARAAEGGDHLHGWLRRWLAAFNDTNLRTYKAFVETYAPSAAPYLDEDLSLRETTGGFELVSARVTAPNEIAALVQDRAWSRRSRVVLQAAEEHALDDISFAGLGPGDPAAEAGPAPDVASLRTRLDQAAHAGRVSGAVLLARDGRPLLKAGYGLADEAAGTANTPRTRFCIGSMGKLFTAVAVMQAVEAGRLALEAPLRAYLPDYPNAAIADQVTLRHLLTHTGGTGDIFGPAYDGHAGSSSDPADLVRLYGARDPQFAPGSRWGYSNYGFVLLGRVLEVVAGKPYGVLVEEQVLGPARMDATTLVFAGRGPTATAYAGARQTGLRPLPPYVGLPAGGGYSSVEDLHRFVIALTGGRLLRGETLRAMTSPLVVAGAGHWGLGFAIRERNGRRYFGHGGAAPGVNGDLAVFTDRTTIVLANRGHPAAACVADLLARAKVEKA